MLQGQMRSAQQVQEAERRVDRQREQNATRQQQRIAHLQTQYRVAYEEVNKYLQSHVKMSEAVFVRLQGRLTAIGNEIRSLGAMPPIANPLANVNYEQYISGFSRLGDVIKSVRHHLMWMASAAVIGAGFGIPMGISKAIESFDALQTKIMQNMELANQYAGNTERLHSDMNKMGEAAKTMAQGFGISLNEVQEGMQIVTRRFKDADTAIYLTSIALQMSKLDMVDVKQSAKDLEAVMLQFGMGAKDAGKFLNDFSVICHVARISGTDMLMALERSGSAFKAMNMDARAAMAAIAAVSTTTGKSGATIGDSWKSILANMDFKKATAALEAYNIKLYEVGANGAKTMRSGTAVLSEILATYQKLDDEGRRKLATAIAGGRLTLAA
jgi:TP901 family phage tail tape measure protein